MHTIFSNTHHPFSVKTFGKKLLLSFCIGCLFSSLLLHPHHTKAAVYKKGFTYRKLTPAIKKKITAVSYRKNPYITYNDLRYIRVLYYDFHGDIQSGELIVNKKIVKKVVKIFYQLYKMKYPIERMQLIDAYHADDLKQWQPITPLHSITARLPERTDFPIILTGLRLTSTHESTHTLTATRSLLRQTELSINAVIQRNAKENMHVI